MKGRHNRLTWLLLIAAVATALGEDLAYGQLGYFRRKSDFYVPSSEVGRLGGTYTSSAGISFAPVPEAYSGGPMSVSLVPGMNRRVAAEPQPGGSFSPRIELGTLASSLKPAAVSSALPSAQPLALPIGTRVPQTTIPTYQKPFVPPKYDFFKPTVTLDTLAETEWRKIPDVTKVLPKGLLSEHSFKQVQEAEASASYAAPVYPPAAGSGAGRLRTYGGGGLPGGREAPAANAGPAGTGGADDAVTRGTTAARPAAEPAVSPEALRELTQTKATMLAEQGGEYLEKAKAALKNGDLRGMMVKPDASQRPIFQPGAIDLFRRARLLSQDNPEPVLGLLVSYVSTGDYAQAASLIGPLSRKWPELLAEPDLLGPYYASPEQMRLHLAAIRQAGSRHNTMDLALLATFYRWFLESRPAAASDAARLANSSEAGSAAASLAVALQQALAGASQ